MMSTRIDSAVDEVREGGEWTSLVDGATHGDDASSSPLRKLVLVRGANDDVIPRDGMRIQLRYTGTLYGTPPDTWSTNDVVESWLSEMQGMEGLMPSFVEYDIDGAKLTNLDEENCMDTMGLTRMQAKKLVMAIRRLVKQRDDHPSGTVFDSSDARDGGEYEFVLTPHDDDGKTSGGRIIRAMDVAVRTMRVGERSLVVCRSDYGYGSTGLRTNGGIVIVPPFATLCFDLTLVGATTIPS
jgi:FKBP-type peptidyl-prolyl cis-trans isomerase